MSGDQTLNVDMVTRMDQTNTALGKIRTEMAALTKSIKEVNAEGKNVGKVGKEFQALTRAVAGLGGVTGEVAHAIGSATSKGMVGALGKFTAAGVAAAVVVKTITAYVDANIAITQRAINAQITYAKVLDATSAKMKDMAQGGAGQQGNVRKVMAAGGKPALAAMDTLAGLPGVGQDQASSIVEDVYNRHGANAPGVLKNIGQAILQGGDVGKIHSMAMGMPSKALIDHPGSTFGLTLNRGLNETPQAAWERTRRNTEGDPYLSRVNEMANITGGIAPGMRKETIANGKFAALEARGEALNPFSAQQAYQIEMENRQQQAAANPSWSDRFGAIRESITKPGGTVMGPLGTTPQPMTAGEFASRRVQEEMMPGLKALERVSLMQLEVSKRVAEGLEKSRNLQGK